MFSIAAIIGLIPASIAKSKGYSFGLWWFYGCLFFIIAIIHVSILPDNYDQNKNIISTNIAYYPSSTGTPADELKKYKDLYTSGLITEEEYEEKKKQLLRQM
jgi:uncharacterized membrane protein